MSSFESAATKRAMKLFEKFNDALTGSLPSKMARKRGELSVVNPSEYLRRSAEVTRSSSDFVANRSSAHGKDVPGGVSSSERPLPEHLRLISSCQIKGKFHANPANSRALFRNSPQTARPLKEDTLADSGRLRTSALSDW